MISEVDEYYNTALREASENGFLKVIEYLIDLGANINCINNYVHVSCENGHFYGSSMEFGENDYLDFGNSEDFFFGDKSFTIEFWRKKKY